MNLNHFLTRTAKLALLLASLWTIGGAESRSQKRSTSHPIRQIDHIMIRTGEPRELFALFTDTLQLPVAWPLMGPRAGVNTGGVGFGLREKQLLGVDAAGQVRIDASKIGGLDLRLVER